MTKLPFVVTTLAALAAFGLAVVACADDSEEDIPSQSGTSGTAVESLSASVSGTLGPASSAATDGDLIRWYDVLLTVPDGLIATPSLWEPGSIPAIYVDLVGQVGDVLVVIDARTGELIHKSVPAEYQGIFQNVLDTIVVEPLDPANSPWPYTGEPPEADREVAGSVEFLRPDPSTGIIWRVSVGVGNVLGGCSYAGAYTNGRSTLAIDLCTGEAFEETTVIAAEDEYAFSELRAEVRTVAR